MTTSDPIMSSQKETACAAASCLDVPPAHVGLEGVDDLSAQVFHTFLATLRLHRHLMARTLAAQGIHQGQALCLRVLAAHGGITQRDLASALHLARPTVTKMLQALEKSGAVRRRPDREDHRLVRVHLTAAGRRLEREMCELSAGYVNDTIGRLSQTDRRELARLLEELGTHIAAVLEEGTPDVNAAAANAGAPRQRARDKREPQ